MSEWLPKDYTPPTGNSAWGKFEKGTTKFRIMSKPILFEQYFTEQDKPFRFQGDRPTDAPEAKQKPDGTYDKTKHTWAFVAYDYEASMFKIYTITQRTVQDAIRAYSSDEDYGEPSGYDIVVEKQGEGLKTFYSVVAKPPKPVDGDIADAYSKLSINLEEMLTNGDPIGEQNMSVGKAPQSTKSISDNEHIDAPF